MLPIPTFYMSAYFEKDRDKYLNKLSAVSEENDYTTWIKYFLEGVIQQAEINTLKAKAMLDKYNDLKEICIGEMSSKYAITMLDEVFKRPAFKAKQIQDAIPGSKATLYNVLEAFVQKGILMKDDKARNTTYYCPDILSLLK